MAKNLSNKFGQKLLDNAKKPKQMQWKLHQKEKLKKTAETTGNLIGNKIADKITSVSKKSPKELQNNETEADIAKKDMYFPKKDNTLLIN